ncbi:uncharacterized protein LOC124165683 [Ischnura elegans]|uniref:uncharacterized protein LOC124165683 n=1 Tax=Ischnura elegans TaxID=197161 RepID=UPI001ED8767B|nr:uncharacterized protein LOC124165683 [Ischnura elegans]
MDHIKFLLGSLRTEFRNEKYALCSGHLHNLKEMGYFAADELYLRIYKNNELLCQYLGGVWTKTDRSRYFLLRRGFYDVLRESIFSSITSEADIGVVNNVLQFCCCTELSPESSISGFDCLCGVVISLKKVMCSFAGQEFVPPITLEIGDPCTEIIVLVEDVMNCAQRCDKKSKPILYSALTLLLQALLVMSGGSPSSKSDGDQWKIKALQNISSKVPSFIDIIKKSAAEGESEDSRDKVKSDHHGMDVDIHVNTHEPIKRETDEDLSLEVFTYTPAGGGVFLRDYWQLASVRNEVIQYLLFTLNVIYQIFIDKTADRECVNFELKEVSSTWGVQCLNGAWRYIRGYLNLKAGNLKEALNELDEADFSRFRTFPTHFESKKALLTGRILLRMEKPMMALTILNKDGLNCTNCLPNVLLDIAEVYETLGYDDSLLGVLRQLVKVLRHRKHMDDQHDHEYPMLQKILDVIHPIPKVSLEMALEKVAYNLCKNKLYEESLEYYLDLLALLEINGPAKVFRFHLHNTAAVLLLLSETSESDRTKEAISLCNKAVTVYQAIPSNLRTSDISLLMDEDCEPSARKRPKLEVDVQHALSDLNAEIPIDDQVNLIASFESHDSFGAKDTGSEGMSDEVNSDSVYSSLMFSEHDLMSCILLSECALRESDFSKSLLLLNKCLQHISHHQVLEGVKPVRGKEFLKTTEFILSTLWLRKAKVLIKKELECGIDFSRDIEHCFRNALLRNPDNADAKYQFVTYLMKSGEETDGNEISSLLEGKFQFNTLSSTPTLNMAIYYIFRCHVSEEDIENLKAKIKHR